MMTPKGGHVAAMHWKPPNSADVPTFLATSATCPPNSADVPTFSPPQKRWARRWGTGGSPPMSPACPPFRSPARRAHLSGLLQRCARKGGHVVLVLKKGGNVVLIVQVVEKRWAR